MWAVRTGALRGPSAAVHCTHSHRAGSAGGTLGLEVGRAVAVGSLWHQVTAVSERALARGAQIPIATRRETVSDGGVTFVVHVLEGIEHKEKVTGEQQSSDGNPFLPPDPDLFVAELSPTHRVVLNKFNVLAVHLLIVTRCFEDQGQLLGLDDLDALAACLEEIDGLGFYNAGRVAGASQSHKHLQLVPLPLGPGATGTPVDDLLATAPEDEPGRLPALPFPHAALRLPEGGVHRGDASSLLEAYRRMLERCSIREPGRPYHLLATRRWMLLVPRTQERFEGFSVNSLGFAGSLLVRDTEQLERVREIGPMRVLAAVAG